MGLLVVGETVIGAVVGSEVAGAHVGYCVGDAVGVPVTGDFVGAGVISNDGAAVLAKVSSTRLGTLTQALFRR